MKPVIIVGSGMAGYTVARELRLLDTDVAITIISRDSADFYSKPMLSNAYRLGKDSSSLVSVTAQQMAAQLNATILPHSVVKAIDTRANTVRVVAAGGSTLLSYGSLVLALGADARRIKLGGNGAADILSVNDLGDYARLRAALDDRRRIAILGAGLIGCEFANDLASAGFAVSLVDRAPWPLSRLLPEPQGRAMADALQKLGVRLYLRDAPVAVQRLDAAYLVQLSSGKTVEVDCVVASAGLLPRTELARTTGLAVAHGIVTNSWLRTSAPDVYALGDCAEVDGVVLAYEMPLLHAARALAQTLHGTPTRVVYPVMPVFVKTPALPALVVAPLATVKGQWQAGATVQPGDAADNGIWEYRNGRNEMHGFALIGKCIKQKNALLTALAAWRS